MPQRIVVRLKGMPNPAVVNADNIEDEGPWIVLRKGDNVVAKFKTAEVVSWEIEPQ
jgi:hypothetical protein